MEAVLALADGRVFRGRAFGAAGERVGEVVFNTSMMGYQEILTDPSYRGQIVVMTSPEIGNVGTNAADAESGAPQVEGFVVRELSAAPSNWRSTQSLHEYLAQHEIPGIAEVDTRAITRHLRSLGVLNGVIASGKVDAEALVRVAREAPGLGSHDLVLRVTCPEVYVWDDPREPQWAAAFDVQAGPSRVRCVAYDFGAKRNIFRLLHESGFDVTVVPATLPAKDALALRPGAVFLSPTDPAIRRRPRTRSRRCAVSREGCRYSESASGTRSQRWRSARKRPSSSLDIAVRITRSAICGPAASRSHRKTTAMPSRPKRSRREPN